MNEIQNNKVNLCDSCSQVYPDCTSKPENVYFGDGIGHDNICACSEYRPKTCGDGDTISRQDTVDVIASMIAYHKTLDDAYWYVKDDAPSAQPQLEICPIYGGMCGYPSNLCYECPRHEGAKEQPQWWTEGLQPFAQPERILAHWETVKNADGASIDFRCSACHRFRFHNGELRKYKFCPNCGAEIEQSTGNG